MSSTVIVILAILVAAGAYRYSIWRDPYRFCKTCGGGKAHHDQVFHGAWGRCWACQGSGKRIRWGVRILAPHVYREIQAGKKGRNY